VAQLPLSPLKVHRRSSGVITTTAMELTFMTDLGQSFVVEIDPNMELENVMALLEAEVKFFTFIHCIEHF
jgi:hypothetical protein